jgi:hypothetical protein
MLVTKPIWLNYLNLIPKLCLARGLNLIINNDGTVTINNERYKTIEEVELLLSSVKRNDLSKNGKIY